MRPLLGIDCKLCVLELMEAAVERERLGIGKRPAHERDELKRLVAARLVIGSEWSEVIRHDPWDQTDLEPSADDLVRERDLFRQTQRMMQWDDVSHPADPDLPGPGRNG